jgi:hypothetical protein
MLLESYACTSDPASKFYEKAYAGQIYFCIIRSGSGCNNSEERSQHEAGVPHMKVALFNDTGIIPHVGCIAVSDANCRMLAGHSVAVVFRAFVGEQTSCWNGNRRSSVQQVLKSSLRSKLEAVDAVIVNGEGTIHHGFGGHLLAILEAAQYLGKKSLLINAVLQDVELFDDVLTKLTDLTVRDIRSSDFLSGRGISHRIVVDSILEAGFESKPLIDLSGRIVVTDWHPSRDDDVGSILRSMLVDSHLRPFFLPLAHGIHRYIWRRIPSTLSTASVLITARHHGIYLAALAGIPFVALPGNTHKIEGLLSLSGFNIPLCTTIDEVDSAILFARNNIGLFDEFNHWLLSHKPLTTFRSLSPSGSRHNPNKEFIDKALCSLNEEVLSRKSHDFLAENWHLWPPAGYPFTRY